MTDREAPTPGVWRVIAPGSVDVCSTQVFTLEIDASDAWKLFPDDWVLMGNSDSAGKLKNESGKFIQSASHRDDGVLTRALGDDLAEEGKL